MDKQIGFEPYITTRRSEIHAEEWLESREGFRFELHADRWQLDSKYSIKLVSIRKLLKSEVIENGFRRTLAFNARRLAAITVKNSFSRLKSFFSFIADQYFHDEISLSSLVNYRDHLRNLDGHDGTMSGVIRPFLKRWNTLKYPGVSDFVVDQIGRWRLKTPERGVAVNREDVNEGPLMPDEHAALEVQWLSSFENGALSLDQFVRLRLISVTGRRPVQIAAIKLKDLDDSRLEDDRSGDLPRRIYLLHIPRAKGVGNSFRSRCRAVPLSIGLWELLTAQRQAVCDKLDTLLNTYDIELQLHDLTFLRREMPLLPSWQIINDNVLNIRKMIAEGDHGDAINELRLSVAGANWHRTGTSILNQVLDRSANIADAKNRDGGALRLFPTRFRYTLEFNLERQGCPPSVIAWNLDHSSTDHLVSYSKNGPDKARRLSKAMALKLTPYVKMFQGEIIDSEADALIGDFKASRLPVYEGTPGATCVKNRGCGMTAIPRCCYNGCPHFRPWVDGPHEDYLMSLLEERDRDFKLLRPNEDKAVIEAGDSVILGVVQVIQLCEQRRAELANERSPAPKVSKRAMRRN